LELNSERFQKMDAKVLLSRLAEAIRPAFE
jgi:hypothetical protein